MNVTIKPERPDSGDSVTLVGELENYLTPLYPPECQYGLSSEQLIRQGVAFFVMRLDAIPAGCGGVKPYGDFAEIKRMYVRPEFRGQGLGKLMLGHLEDYARERDICIMRLETGPYQCEAIGLYERMGYVQIPAFGPYKPSPLNLFYEKRLDNRKNL